MTLIKRSRQYFRVRVQADSNLFFLYRNKKELYGEFHCIALLFDTILGLFRRLQVQSKMSALWDSSRDVAVNEASKLGQRIA